MNAKLTDEVETMATEDQKRQAWNNAKPIPGKNPNKWRRDSAGNQIYKPAYGTNGNQGWEVDHRKPRSKGGTNSPRNLQAMQTAANRRKGNKYPYP